tara:strand:+ start:271 stop:729 length:459 start_codon:yes stop_codon:yes gene_type:complete
MNGRIRAIQTSPGSGEPMVSHAEIVATPGRGLEGDRYSLGRGAWVKEIKPGDHELTLIETEQLEWFRRETGQELTHRMSRRNLLTQGIDLNALVGKRFHVGDVEVEGMRLCEPCKTLQQQTGLDILPAMVGRSGLNCRVLTAGVIRIDDAVG